MEYNIKRDRISTDLVLPDGTRYAGRLQTDANGEPRVEIATCGHCGFTWNDALITAITPTPAGRCPNEYAHTYPAWAEDPNYPVGDWRLEVANDDTRLGYVEWLEHKREPEPIELTPPWAAAPYYGDSDKWGDEQDRSEFFEGLANELAARLEQIAPGSTVESERESEEDEDEDGSAS